MKKLKYGKCTLVVLGAFFPCHECRVKMNIEVLDPLKRTHLTLAQQIGLPKQFLRSKNFELFF